MLLEFVRARGGTVIDILVGIALIYLVYRLDQRRRERKRTASIDAEPLIAALPGTSGRLLAQPKVLDARPLAASRNASDTLNAADRPQPIPGALALDPHSPDQVDCALRAYDMVIYCICPDSATAVEITQRMRLNGYTRIRALRGGLDAWQKRGFPVEPECDAAGEPVRGKRPRDKRNAASGAITLRGLAPRRVEGT
jgi:rhodanese-related sulfurtransferase